MEPVKDYYSVLRVSPKASTEEIKKAFRKLALTSHPDKHNNSAAATEKFTVIQEAYHILSDPKKRSAYNYQRYLQNPLHANKPTVHTAEDVLQLSKKLDKEIALIDPHRIDRDLLYFQVMEILADEHLSILEDTNDISINREIIRHVKAASQHLSLGSIQSIGGKLFVLTEKDAELQKVWQQFIDQSKQSYYWNRYKSLIALGIAVLVCVLIYLAKR